MESLNPIRSFYILTVSSFVALPFAPVYSQAQAVSVPAVRVDFPSVVARGSAEISDASQRLSLMFGVESRADSPPAAVADNAQRTARIRAALMRAGVPAASITVGSEGYVISPDRMPMRPLDTIAPFRQFVRNSIRVDGIDSARSQEIIETAVSAGATSANVIYQPTAVSAAERERALGDAAANARRNAEVMARALGGTLGELVEVSNVQAFPPEGQYYEGPRGRFPRASVSVVGRWRLLFPGR